MQLQRTLLDSGGTFHSITAVSLVDKSNDHTRREREHCYGIHMKPVQEFLQKIAKEFGQRTGRFNLDANKDIVVESREVGKYT